MLLDKLAPLKSIHNHVSEFLYFTTEGQRNEVYKIRLHTSKPVSLRSAMLRSASDWTVDKPNSEGNPASQLSIELS